MQFYRKQFVAELILEIIMVVAPTNLDYLGAVGEFILKLDQPTTESISFTG